MAETYLEITQQIEALKQKAASIRDSEIAGVVERIRQAISAYGLTADQLFEPTRSTPRAKASGKSGPPAGNRGSAPRFRDDAGNSWSGRGPRPRWVKAALAAGRSIEEFAVEGVSATPAPVARAKRSAGRAPSTPKYKDAEGHSWSGRGPRPGWVKAALEAGKTLDDFL